MKRIVKQLRHGQVTIPKDLRDAAGIEPHDLLSIDVIDGKLQVEPVKVTPKHKSSPWAAEFYEMFAPARKSLRGRSEAEVNEAIGESLKKVRARKR